MVRGEMGLGEDDLVVEVLALAVVEVVVMTRIGYFLHMGQFRRQEYHLLTNLKPFLLRLMILRLCLLLLPLPHLP